MQRDEYTGAMTKAIQTAKAAAALQVIGNGVGLAARIFALPALAMYAWNGMTTLPDWPYWPTVAAFAVVNVLILHLHGLSK